jgi:hypothetical protein
MAMNLASFDVLDSIISPVTGRILCDYNYILVGNAQGIAIPTIGVPIGTLPNLTFNKTWVGDEDNRPIEKIYIGDTTFVIRLTNADLPSAQVLLPLGLGLLKVIADGYLAIATPLIDYATVAYLAPLLVVGAASLLEAQANSIIISGLVLPASLAAITAAGAAIDAKTFRENADEALEPLYTVGLNSLPNYGDINMQGFRMINLKQSPEGDFDAVSFTFLWDLMHGRVDITE